MPKRKCKQCQEYQDRDSGVQHPSGWFCSQDHAIKFAQDKGAKNLHKMKKKAANQIKEKQKAERRTLKKRKEAIKTASETRAEAQSSINRYIRIRDRFKPCISCGGDYFDIQEQQSFKTGGAWDAGHYKSRGAKGQLRFVLFNIHAQCKSCNGGSKHFAHKAETVGKQYRVNLIERIGIERVEWLDNNNEIDLRKNDSDYHRRIKRIFNKKARLYERRFR